LSPIDLFREIIAPCSTLALSLAALAMAWSFSTTQGRLAEARLNFDAFDKRFQIYEAARALIDRVKRHEDAEARTNELRAFGMRIEQARFFLDPATQDFLREISVVSSRILAARDRRGSLEEGSDDEQWLILGKELSAYDAKLTELNGLLAPTFERAIALPRLTRSDPGVASGQPRAFALS
jgi:hypothetical protein